MPAFSGYKAAQLALSGNAESEVPIAPSWLLFGTGGVRRWFCRRRRGILKEGMSHRLLMRVGNQIIIKKQRKGGSPFLRGGSRQKMRDLIWWQWMSPLVSACPSPQAQASEAGPQEEQGAGDEERCPRVEANLSPLQRYRCRRCRMPQRKAKLTGMSITI